MQSQYRALHCSASRGKNDTCLRGLTNLECHQTQMWPKIEGDRRDDQKPSSTQSVRRRSLTSLEGLAGSKQQT